MADLANVRHPRVPPIYRAYSIGLAGGIIGAQVIGAVTDAAASAAAQALATLHPIELWDRGRFLGRFDPRLEGPLG